MDDYVMPFNEKALYRFNEVQSVTPRSRNAEIIDWK
jgi:hypothetical protein